MHGDMEKERRTRENVCVHVQKRERERKREKRDTDGTSACRVKYENHPVPLKSIITQVYCNSGKFHSWKIFIHERKYENNCKN